MNDAISFIEKHPVPLKVTPKEYMEITKANFAVNDAVSFIAILPSRQEARKGIPLKARGKEDGASSKISKGTRGGRVCDDSRRHISSGQRDFFVIFVAASLEIERRQARFVKTWRLEEQCFAAIAKLL